jgi:signal transduction histidine kinase
VTDRIRSRLAWTIAIASVAGLVLAEALKLAWDLSLGEDVQLFVPVLIGAIAMGWIGATIAVRTRNPLGWILLAIPAGTTVSLLAEVLTEHGGPSDAWYAPMAYWLTSFPFFASLLLFVAVFYLFPDGALPSPRWRWPWRVYLAASAILLTGFTVLPASQSLEHGGVVSNPFGIDALEPVLSPILAVAGITVVLSAFAALASLVVRFRRADEDERQQLRWLFAVALAGAVLFVIVFLLGVSVADREEGTLYVIQQIVFFLFVVVIVLGVPLAMGVAILRYRLYDLDVVIRKTVAFATVVVVIVALYTAVALLAPIVVLGVGASTADVLLPLALGVAIGLLVFPVRERARRFADRVVYGRRATPYEVLAEFSGRLAETYSTDDVLPRMVQLVIAGTGATEARVWLRVERELRAVASGPDGVASAEPRAMTEEALPAFDEALAVFPIRHQGELTGAITLVLPANDPLDAEKERLVNDLAGQAGLVLRNVRLIEELRASRGRIVAAQDEERRRIERNIHDGAQQQLVALSIQLRLAEELADRDPATAKAMLGELQTRSSEALDDLRDLARGIYPPLLADQGLAAAIEAQARKAAVPTVVRVEQIARYPRAVESAVYFSVLECLQNVAKYANASKVVVRISERNGDLTFAVTDDGDGFDPGAAGYGTGLQGMADRLDAVAGRLEVRSSPGAGTTVTGELPAMGVTP